MINHQNLGEGPAAGYPSPVVNVEMKAAAVIVGESGGDSRLPDAEYPVPGRTPLRNRRIAGHEIGHVYTAKVLGNHVHAVTIIPDQGYDGQYIRSGAPTSLSLSITPDEKIDEILSIRERLERMTPELGSPRIEDAENYICAQSNIIELVGAEVCELLLHPELPALGAKHDFVEAVAFARASVAATPAAAALIEYAIAEATALLKQGVELGIVQALVEALIGKGTLYASEIDTIISDGIAAKSLSDEHRRRTEWKLRQRNAAELELMIAGHGQAG
jgi:hypothetical protein